MNRGTTSPTCHQNVIGPADAVCDRRADMQKLLKRIWEIIASNVTDAPLLLRWCWYDWIFFIAIILTAPYSVPFAILWLVMKLAIGEDFKSLKHKEKAFYFYQQELKNVRYQLGVLKRMKSVRDIDPSSSQVDIDTTPSGDDQESDPNN
jgi:hypothetical protein